MSQMNEKDVMRCRNSKDKGSVVPVDIRFDLSFKEYSEYNDDASIYSFYSNHPSTPFEDELDDVCGKKMKKILQNWSTCDEDDTKLEKQIKKHMVSRKDKNSILKRNLYSDPIHHTDYKDRSYKQEYKKNPFLSQSNNTAANPLVINPTVISQNYHGPS